MKKPLILFISLFYIDLVFILISFGSISFGAFIRIILSNATIALLTSFIKNDKIFKRCAFILLAIFSIYSFAQLEFKNLLEVFYSFKAVGNGVGAIKDYFWFFITSAKPSYFLVFLSLLIYIILDKYLVINEKKIIENIYKKIYKDQYKKKLRKVKKLTVLQKILICTNLFTVTILSPLISHNDNLVQAYNYNDNFDIILENVGSTHFLFKDLYSLAFPKKMEFVIEDIGSPLDNEDIAEEIKTTIDDTKWISLMEEEPNTTIKNIDEYLMSQPTNHETLHTGEFEDYNFIFFLTESLDYIAIDENLTPTLYKMWNESYHFTNHYTPIYSCATGDSEFVSMTGLYPFRNICSVYEVLNTNLTTSLAGLFKQKGYSARSFHNWTDEFYQRTKLELAYGADEYKDIDDLGIKQILGWQSDVELVEKSLPYFINDDKFFAFLITSSMHFPYDTSSALGDKYINEINQYYPNYSMDVKRYISKSMEFDKALETLLTRLEEAGKLDNTVISIFADHRPLKFNQATFISCSQLRDRTGIHGIDLTPFFIYNSGTKGKEITSLCSTVDHLPTIANLFNLNYDPRLYMGHDAFGEDCIVVFNDLNWISKKGTYSNEKASEGLDEEYVEAMKAHVKNITNISKTILEYNYFEKRKEIIYPEYK